MTLSRLLLPLLLLTLTGCSSTSSHLQSKVDINLDAEQPGYPIQYVASLTSRTVDLTQPPRDVWERTRRGFAIPNLRSPLVDQWTAYYASHPEALQDMARRAGKYLYYILDEIERRDMPTELALLPFVESAYNPVGFSHAQAAGLWQFIPTTGLYFNLKQDWWHDQRRDPVASTHAALNYLAALFTLRGDWYLALASYNWGENSIQRAMAKNEAVGLPTDHQSLLMPEETRNYVPKLQAIKNIIADPQKFGIVLPSVENKPYFTTVRRTHDVDMDVAVAARLAGISEEEFKALNPAFNRPIIRGGYAFPFLLPTDRVAAFRNNLARYKGKLSSWKVYIAQRGESYAGIARRFRISEAKLRKINGIPARQKRTTLARLLVPRIGHQKVQVAALPPNHSTAAKSSAVAKSSAIAESSAVAKNSAIAESSTIAKSSAIAKLPRPIKTASLRSATAPSPTLKLNPTRPKLRRYKVRSGDNLSTVAQQHRISVETLRSLNNLKSHTLKVGSILRVPGTKIRG